MNYYFRLALKTYPREVQLVGYTGIQSARSWLRALMVESMTKREHDEIFLSFWLYSNYWYGYRYGMHTHMQVYITIRMDDGFTLNCRPTFPVGCEEQVVGFRTLDDSATISQGQQMQPLWHSKIMQIMNF